MSGQPPAEMASVVDVHQMVATPPGCWGCEQFAGPVTLKLSGTQQQNR